MSNCFNQGYIIANDFNVLTATALKAGFIYYQLTDKVEVMLAEPHEVVLEKSKDADVFFVFLLEKNYDYFFKQASEIRHQLPAATIVCIDFFGINAAGLNRFLALKKCVVTSRKIQLPALIVLIEELEYKNLSISHDVLERLVAENLEQSNKGHQQFTKMERSIIDAAKSGMTIAQTAEKLHISSFTVVNHRSNIFKKAGVNSIMQLVAQIGETY